MAEEGLLSSTEAEPENPAPEGEIPTESATTDTPATEQAPPVEGYLTGDRASDPTLSRFKDADALGDAYLALRKKSGAMTGLPGEESSVEERDLFFRKLGKPERSEDYVLPEVAGETNEELDAWFRDVSFGNNFTQEQVTALYGQYGEMMQKQIEASDVAAGNAQDETVGQLKAEWGTNYEANLSKANQAFKTFFTPEAAEALSNAGLADNKELIMSMLNMSNSVAGDSVAGTTNRGSTGDTAETVDAEIEKWMNHDDRWGSETIQKRLAELFQKKYDK